MRQGGFKPKGHNSGTYWVRANANSGCKGKKTKHSDEEIEDFGEAIDSLTSERTTTIAKNVGRVIVLGIAGYLLYIGVTYPPNIFN